MNPEQYPGPLFTDLYELTMAASYFAEGLEEEATFSLYIRPNRKRSYFVAAGLEQVLDHLSRWSFSASDLDYLRRLSLFRPEFINYLGKLKFSGQLRAMAEGTIFFADEPILELRAPIIQAQLLETYLINAVGTATLIATKAARCVYAARGKTLVDFALRRTQGTSAGMTVARSSYLAGFDATSNVLAGKLLGIPVSGTMAHSYVLAFENEIDAFRAYAKAFPQNTVLLIDTYDTIEGARNAITVAREMQAAGKKLNGVRLDSGDMAGLSRQVRGMLDAAGLQGVKIFASSGFDEYKIEALLNSQAAIDAFGVGTKLGVSADAPYFDMVYKLVRYGDRDVRKLSPAKATLAGSKQVYRRRDKNGDWLEDVIALASEQAPSGAYGLLEPVMREGRIIAASTDLDTIRRRFRAEFELLDRRYKRLDGADDFPVSISPGLAKLQAGTGPQ